MKYARILKVIMIDKYFEKLLCPTSYTTIDEIVTEFRVLAKKYHPDLNVGIDTSKFISLKHTYDYLLEKHIPTPKPKPKLDLTGFSKYYRMLDKKPEQSISLPYPNDLDEDVIIYFMIEGYEEFRLPLFKGTKLPLVFDINNLSRPLRLRINGIVF